MKICVTFSAGGHYVEAMRAISEIEEYPKYFVTYKSNHLQNSLRNNKVYYITHPKHCFILRRMLLFIINFFQSLYVLLKERPDIIISTGADVTLNTLLIGKILKKKIIFIETGASVYNGSQTGKLVYHFADLFLIQWKELKKIYPKAVYGGPLL